MASLGVNIDHVATIRQARGTIEPDPLWAAVEAELAGASCITFHLRVDRRHINDRDARLLGQSVRGRLNMEMSMESEIVATALEIAPDQATLVPEGREELTTEGGLDVVAHAARVCEVSAVLREAGIVVSAFVDPIDEQILAARDAGCAAVELHTGTYANAFLVSPRRPAGAATSASDATHLSAANVQEALEQLQRGVRTAHDAGLIVHGGHGLTYDNVAPVAEIEEFCEFNIGHSIVARAVFTGLREAVAEMNRLIRTAGNR